MIRPTLAWWDLQFSQTRVVLKPKKIVISDAEGSNIPLPICNFAYKQHASPSFYSFYF